MGERWARARPKPPYGPGPGLSPTLHLFPYCPPMRPWCVLPIGLYPSYGSPREGCSYHGGGVHIKVALGTYMRDRGQEVEQRSPIVASYYYTDILRQEIYPTTRPLSYNKAVIL